MENTPNNGKVVKPLLRRGLGRLPAWLRSKYFISFAAFCAVMFFLDKNDVFTQWDRTRELKNLRQSKEYYTTRIAAELKELEALKHNPTTLEKYAREKYLMKRDNEELFIIPENYEPPKN
ncbi:MAG: FtsB family cell division protein [Bacteroidota bacterium]